MQAKKQLEKPLKWFILPNESYKWDFILAKYVDEGSQQEATAERRPPLCESDATNHQITKPEHRRKLTFN
jgi:hypothetical protein